FRVLEDDGLTALSKMDAKRIPAFINPESGTAEGARTVLAAGPFDVHEVPPSELRARIADVVEAGATRVLVAGGDGTIRTAVEIVAGKPVELAVLPAGTLNHFAKDHELPVDLDKAAVTAARAPAGPVDVGRVGEHLFHGTSSIGAYVLFMRIRDRLEPRLGYRISTFIAGILTFFRMPSIAVELDIDGAKRIYRTPLLFVAVGERELKLPTLGGRVKGGKRGLHLMIVHGRRKARMLVLALDAFSNGVREASRAPEFDAFIVDRCTIRMRRRHARISFDGEAQNIETPLEYQLERDMLLLVGGETSTPA
ncbi:MAG TPA: diacylglycerol kinase family protein, partial [Gemmatimonadaceae bacterium]|nr:diacylglycerol kinase family protein [Gemmatimonadaceae bacterium]